MLLSHDLQATFIKDLSNIFISVVENTYRIGLVYFVIISKDLHHFAIIPKK